MNLYTPSTRQSYADNRKMSAFDGVQFLHAMNQQEFYRIERDVMNSCPFFRSLSADKVAQIMACDPPRGQRIVQSIWLAICEQYEYECDRVMRMCS